jgi:hypothetical protein
MSIELVALVMYVLFTWQVWVAKLLLNSPQKCNMACLVLI